MFQKLTFLRVSHFMRYNFRFLFPVVIICVSCVSISYEKEFDHVDSIIRETPDSAMMRLLSIDKDRIVRAGDRARYALLYATALERSFSDTTDVNIILPAIRYFEKHGPEEYLMRAYHCLGRFYQNGKDWQKAYLSYKKAEELAELSSDYYFKSVLCSSIRYVLGMTHHNEEWLTYCEKTLEYSNRYAKDSSWISRDLMEYATALSDCGLYEKSDSVFNAAALILVRETANPTELLYGAQTAMRKVGIRPELAIEYIERALAMGAELNDDLAYTYSYALILQGQKGKAEDYLDSLRKFPPTLESNYWNYKICRRLKDYKSAMEYCEEFSRLNFKDYNDKNNISVHKAEAKRNEAVAALNKAESRIFRLLFLLALMFLFAVIVTGFYIYQLIRRKRQEELSKMEDIAEETSRLLGTNQALEDKYLRLQQSFCSVYQNQLSELGRLCENGISDIDAATIKNKAVTVSTEKIEKIIKDIRGKKESQLSLEKEIDANLDSIIAKIRKDFPEFEDEDILFICYMAMHFDSTTIAFLADISKSNVRVKKHRYREKILSKSSSNQDLYRVVLQ